MKIGIAAPIYLPYLSEYLDGVDESRPIGLGGFSVTYLVQALLEQGESVSIYSLDPNVLEPTFFSGQQLKVYLGPWRPRPRNRILDLMRKERRWITQFIKQDQPDIVNAHWTYEFALGTIEAKVPHLITVRDWAPTILRFQKHPYRLLRLLMDRWCLRQGHDFSANSPYLQTKLAEKLRRSVALTPNAIPSAWFSNESKQRQKVFRVCSINNGFSERKNVKALLQAFRLCILSQSGPQQLQLVGQGFEKNGSAQQWARLNGCDEGVEFLGPLSGVEVRALLDRSDLLMHPALEESFGMTLVEAMARRVPVIAGIRSGAVPWVLNEGKAGLLVDVQNPEAIAEAILSLQQDPLDWKKYSDAGYESVRSRFHATRVAGVYKELFKDILSRAKRELR